MGKSILIKDKKVSLKPDDEKNINTVSFSDWYLCLGTEKYN